MRSIRQSAFKIDPSGLTDVSKVELMPMLKTRQLQVLFVKERADAVRQILGSPAAPSIR